MAAGQGRREGGRARRRAALARRGPARRSPCCCTRTCPRRRRSCSRALGEPELALDGAAFGAPARRRHASATLAPLFPQAAVIDSHTHLDVRPATDAEHRRARARAAGVTRILTIGHRRESSRRAALAAAEATTRCAPPIGHHPNSATGFDDATSTSCASSRATRAAPRSARPAWTTTATTRRAPTRSARSRAQIGLARELGKPLVIHTRAAEDDTIATLARDADGPRGDPALLLDARPARGVPRARLVDLVRRQRHLPEGARPGRRRRAGPARPPARRDRRAVPDARRRSARSATSRPTSSTPRASSPSGAGSPTRSSRRAVAREQPPGCSAGERAPVQPSLRRMRRVRRSGRTATSARTS